MQVEKLSGNPMPLDILAKINQIIDNMVVSVNGNGTDENGNIDVATIPVGFNYVQYPGESAPADLFGGEWENISAQFAGQFFRCEGGNAATFGETQQGGAPNITGSMSVESNGLAFLANASGLAVSGCFVSPIMGTGGAAESAFIGRPIGINFSAANSDATYSANEVRPYNSTIRIWKRIA